MQRTTAYAPFESNLESEHASTLSFDTPWAIVGDSESVGQIRTEKSARFGDVHLFTKTSKVEGPSSRHELATPRGPYPVRQEVANCPPLNT